MELALNKLRLEDIEEKIRLNEQTGIDIYNLRELLRDELKEWQWVAIRSNVQSQFLSEQLEHIEKVIKQREEKAIEQVRS